MTYSLQLILVLIIYSPPNDQPNAFRKSLSRLHRVEDFQFIQQGITLVLTQPVSGVASYVPTVSRALPWAPEMLVLSWELLQCNKRFRSFIIDTDRAHDFIVLVLYYAMDAKDDPARQGIVRMCVFILQTLSVEPTFGRRLNKPFVGQDSLPSTLRIPNFHGTYADYLITSLHTILTTTKGRLESIYPALLAIVNNIAPYVQDLQRATCTKLLDLFISFSSPAFLLANETNHTLLLSLLEAMSAVLDHQHGANRRFVDIVCRTHKRFEALRDFTVDGALSEVDRINQERKDRNGSISEITSPTRGASIDSIRSPASSRSPSLGNVPEHGAFAIGDDEDDDEDLETPINNPHSRSHSNASTSMEDAVPVQTRSMSEKARGKQPVGQSAFSRSASRNTSNTSLASLQTQTPHPLTTSTQFTPTAEWLESWLPHMPLHTILQVIEEGKSGTSRPRGQQPPAGSTSKEDSTTAPSPTTECKSASLLPSPNSLQIKTTPSNSFHRPTTPAHSPPNFHLVLPRPRLVHVDAVGFHLRARRAEQPRQQRPVGRHEHQTLQHCESTGGDQSEESEGGCRCCGGFAREEDWEFWVWRGQQQFWRWKCWCWWSGWREGGLIERFRDHRESVVSCNGVCEEEGVIVGREGWAYDLLSLVSLLGGYCTRYRGVCHNYNER